MDYKKFDIKIKQLIKKIESLNDFFEKIEFKCEKPSSQKDIQNKENELGIKIPKQLSDFFLKYSSNFHIYSWLIDVKGWNTLPKYCQIMAVRSRISIDDLIVTQPRDYVEEDKWYTNKLSFIAIGNGDEIAIDLNDYSIVYLDHECDEGFKVANSFDEFLENWLDLMLISPELWTIEHFINNNILDSNCENAKLFKEFFSKSSNEIHTIIKKNTGFISILKQIFKNK